MNMRTTIHDIVLSIEPLDSLEAEQLSFTLNWLQTAREIFRIAKPATPETHLVSYFVVLDPMTQQILLTDHKKSGLWLPTGGHVELDEHPAETVRREAKEELGLEAEFFEDKPLFLTVTKTVGATAGHTDVSLWYVLRGNCAEGLEFDREEFKEVRWFEWEAYPRERADPHMGRFIQKLKHHLSLNCTKSSM